MRKIVGATRHMGFNEQNLAAFIAELSEALNSVPEESRATAVVDFFYTQDDDGVEFSVSYDPVVTEAEVRAAFGHSGGAQTLNLGVENGRH